MNVLRTFHTTRNGIILVSQFQNDPSTAFLRAARAGQLEKVLEFLDAGVDINSSNAVSRAFKREETPRDRQNKFLNDFRTVLTRFIWQQKTVTLPS